jgi:CBS domain containing-hemolysin-like protein
MSDDPVTPPEKDTDGRSRGLFGFARRSGSNGRHGEAGMSDQSGSPQAMRLRIARFEAGRVEDVMIPRADVIAVDIETGFGDLIKLFAKATHSRLPIYRETLDDPLGFVHIKDVVAEIARGTTPPERPLEKLQRNILFVPPSMKLTDLLVKMQAMHIHIALVVDEYGGTDGLVSLEDLVEEIVGEIEDEHDEEAAMFIRRGKHLWECDARMEIEDFAEKSGFDLSLPSYEDDIDTLGGIAFALAGRVPERGEVLPHPGGTEIEIMEADGRRIRRLRLRTPDKPSTPSETS